MHLLNHYDSHIKCILGICTYPYVHDTMYCSLRHLCTIMGWKIGIPLWPYAALKVKSCLHQSASTLVYLACFWSSNFTLCFTNKPLKQFINSNSIRYNHWVRDELLNFLVYQVSSLDSVTHCLIC